MKKNIAVLSGGYSEEAQVSKRSVETIIKHLDKNIFDVYHISIENEGWFLLHDGLKIQVNKSDFSVALSDNKLLIFDYAYIMVHGTPGEDGLLQAYFQLLKIPFSTSNHFASTLTFNKWACNQLLKARGFSVADAILLRKGDLLNLDEIINTLSLPVFVKPNDGGSSFGITKVKHEDDLEPALLNAFEHGSEVVIEEELTGTELSNGAVMINDEITVLPITEIITENDFFDYEAKYEGKSKEITPAQIGEENTSIVKKVTKAIYQTVGLKGIVRIDYMLSQNKVYVIEINTIPGMTPQSFIPQQLKHENRDLQKILSDLILADIND